MGYQKQNFIDGMVLTAEHLNHMEEGIGQSRPAAPPLSPSAP